MERPYKIRLKQIRSETHESFMPVWTDIANIVPIEWVDYIIDKAVREVKQAIDVQNLKWEKVAYAWSGGKDSIALQVVMDRVGIEKGMIGMSAALEYPAFLDWLAIHKPPGIQIVDTGADDEWLVNNQEMLFPNDGPAIGRWLNVRQVPTQRRYYLEHDLDMMMFGRRLADGNFVGRKNDAGYYTTKAGFTHYNPIRDWKHEDVLAVVYHYGIPMPPFYGWVRGFEVGTGPWPERKVKSHQLGWEETYSVDPTIVHGAAEYLPGAAKFLEELDDRRR